MKLIFTVVICIAAIALICTSVGGISVKKIFRIYLGISSKLRRTELNLLNVKDLTDKNHFCAILVFNHFGESTFLEFIQSIIDCKPLIAELCSAEYEELVQGRQYRFESDEGETVIITYADVLSYARITLQRYIDICVNDDKRKNAEKLLKKIC